MLHLNRVEAERLCLEIDEDGSGAGPADAAGGREEGERGQDDLVAWTDLQCVQGQQQRIRAGGAADGTFAVDGGSEGADVTRTDADPDLECSISTVSAAWLGGVRWSELAGAGLVEERTPGALVRADAMFVSSPLPFPFTWF